MKEYNGNRNEEGLKLYNIRRKNKKNQTNNIIPFNIKVCVLYHNFDKVYVLDMESKLINQNLKFENDLANVKSNSNRKVKLLNYFDYFVVILSEKCLKDYTLMEVLIDNFVMGKPNKKIIPIFIEQDLYEPETRAKIIKWWIDRCDDYNRNYFRGKFGDDISKTLEKMQQISEMLKEFLEFAIEKDIRSDEEPYIRLIKKIEEYSGIVHERLTEINEEHSGIVCEKLTKKNEEYSDEIYKRSDIVIQNTYNNCQFVEAKDNSTVTATQNNGIGKDELNSIIDSIQKNLEKLNQEQIEDLQDIMSMVVEELNNGTPRVGRLKKCLTSLAPLMTVTNGIPVLADNLQKLYNYILPFIN